MPRRSRSRFSSGTRRCSSTDAVMRDEPGRVDSAPISMMSAPCSSSSMARAKARSGSEYLPPSENESGVTFSTPMITGRSPSRISRCFNFQKKSFLTVLSGSHFSGRDGDRPGRPGTDPPVHAAQNRRLGTGWSVPDALPVISNLDQQFRGRVLEQYFFHLLAVDLHGARLDLAYRVAHRFGETHARQEFVYAERAIH